MFFATYATVQAYADLGSDEDFPPMNMTLRNPPRRVLLLVRDPTVVSQSHVQDRVLACASSFRRTVGDAFGYAFEGALETEAGSTSDHREREFSYASRGS